MKFIITTPTGEPIYKADKLFAITVKERATQFESKKLALRAALEIGRKYKVEKV